LGSIIPDFRHKGDTQTHRQQDDLTSLLIYFQDEESRLKIEGGTQKEKGGNWRHNKRTN
jgi:hypothetical protein